MLNPVWMCVDLYLYERSNQVKTHLIFVGRLDLRNGVELYLEKGAVLEAAYGLENYYKVSIL